MKRKVENTYDDRYHHQGKNLPVLFLTFVCHEGDMVSVVSYREECVRRNVDTGAVYGVPDGHKLARFVGVQLIHQRSQHV